MQSLCLPSGCGIITRSFPISLCSLSDGERRPVCECKTTPTTDLTLGAIPNMGHSQPFPALDMAHGGVFLATYI